LALAGDNKTKQAAPGY